MKGKLIRIKIYCGKKKKDTSDVFTCNLIFKVGASRGIVQRVHNRYTCQRQDRKIDRERSQKKKEKKRGRKRSVRAGVVKAR